MAIDTLPPLREVIAAHGLQARKQLGQNFLLDLNLTARIARTAGPLEGTTIIEVGPGPGGLTRALLAAGARQVVAIERDERTLPALAQIAEAYPGRLEVLAADALDVDYAALADGPTRIVANLPYNIATPLVAQCLLDTWSAMHGESGLCRFSRLTFTVQLEVAQRMAAGPGDEEYGPISVLAGLLGRMTVGPVIPATAFWPQPKVNSRILRIDFDEQAADRIKNAADLAQIIFLAFNQRRKQIGPILQRRLEGATGADVEAALKLAGVEPQQRAQSIKPEQFMLIANSLPQTPR
mgnify:CR=1 FL=1